MKMDGKEKCLMINRFLFVYIFSGDKINSRRGLCGRQGDHTNIEKSNSPKYENE
jgi:hypothetical protein